MIPSGAISEQDWELIRELLEREQAQVLLELRHTRTASFRAALHDRLNLIGAILSRFEISPAARAADSTAVQQ